MKFLVEVTEKHQVCKQVKYLVEAASREQAKQQYAELGTITSTATLFDDWVSDSVESVTPMGLSVGSLVKAKSEHNPLRSGCSEYNCAVVISMTPFVLVSLETDMRWGAMNPEDVEVIGQATDVQLGRCMRRL